MSSLRATRKSMLEAIQETRKSKLKEIHAPISGTNILETWNFSKISRTNLKKQKC
jgi:hypothetical protein